MKWHLFILGLALALAACQPPIPGVVHVDGIVLSVTSQTLPPGTQYQLSAQLQPANASDQAVTWTSSAPGVASVSGGLVQAKANGSATIIATSHDGGFTATCAVTVQTQVIPPPAGLTGPVLAALYDGSAVRLWDGTNTVVWKTGTASHGNGSKITVGQVLYFLDSSGAITQAINLPALPAGVTVIGDPVTYTFEALSAQQSYDIDYTPGAHTRIWQDGAEYGDWHANTWNYASSFETENGDVIALDDLGRFHDITNAALVSNQIVWAVEGGPLFYEPDTANPNALVIYDSAHPGGRSVTVTGGGFPWPGRQPWIQAGGVWYDGYGDVWDPGAGTFTTHANALQQFALPQPPLVTSQGSGLYHDNGQYSRMIPAYVDSGMVFFIECTSGSLISFSPSTGVAAFVQFLYTGDGWQTTGEALSATLLPEDISGSLYYHQGTTLWKRDSSSTVISSFSADQKLWVMK